MKVGSLSRNTLAALGQAVLVSGMMFLVYRVVVQSAGLEELGMWSLIMTGSTVARAGDVSGAGGLGRFIAMIRSGTDIGSDIVETTHTVLLTSAAINLTIGIALYFLAPFVLRFALTPELLPRAIELLPFVVVIIVLGGLAGAVISGIDGTQRIDLRAMVAVSSAVVSFLIVLVLVPRIGIVGFGIAQVVSQFFTIIVGWTVLHRQVPEIGWFPYRWQRTAFRASTGFGLKLNGISLLTLLFDPLVKFSFGATGGASQVALYELASRAITQIRGFAVAASMALIPVFASMQPHEQARRIALLEKAVNTSAYAAVAAAAAATVLAPIVSLIVLGKVSAPLLYMSVPLIFAWTMQLPTVPVYLAAQTDGRMRWNALSHALVAVAVIAGALLERAGIAGTLLTSIVVGLLLSSLTVLTGNVPMLGLTEVMRKSRTRLALAAFIIVSICAAGWFSVSVIAA
jgi:O-antigen/teichoic acid export membrane protein